MSQTFLPSLGQPLLAAMDAVGSGLTAAVDADCWPLSDAEVGQLLDEIDVAEARLAAVKLTAVAEADRRGLGRADGAPSTAAWLRQRHLTHPGAAASTVALAGALDRRCQATAAALGGGRLSAGHAQVIVATRAALPPVEPDVQARAEDFLIAQATALDPLLLARAGRALGEALHTAPESDAHSLRQTSGRQLTRVVARRHGALGRLARRGS